MDGIIVEKIPTGRFTKKEVKFHFGMWVWLAIADKHGVWLDDLGKIDALELSIDALTFAAQWGEYMDGKKRTVTYDKMKKWADLIPAMQYGRIQEAMMQSRVGGESIMSFAEKSKKKQAQKS